VLRFTTDFTVPFDNYADVRIMPMLAPGLLWRAGIVLGSSA